LELHEERLDNVHWDALDAFEWFNRESISAFAQEMEKRAAWFRPDASTPAMQSVPLDSLRDWFLPHFVRADALAGRYQKRHHSLATPIFVLSTLAVGFAGAQAVFSSKGKTFLYGEVACIVALIVVVFVGLRSRPSRRWIAYRFLAERLRSAFFLAAAGLDDEAPQFNSVNVDTASAGWLSRAYVEVWKKRERFRPDATDVPALRSFLVTRWVESQAQFHRTRSEANERAHRRLKAAIWALLALTLAAPLVHISGRLEGSWPHWFSFLSISLPALGAAVTGFGEQREYELLAERYRRMNVELENAAVHMLETEDIEEVWSVAARTEALMREENRDWFGLMRFRDIAPHV
jgi:hypothetical protein